MRTSNFHTMPLAIIGMACRYPGADNLEEYWRLILERRCAIRELASDRLNRNHCYSSTRGVKGKSYSAIGGVVDQRPLDETLCPIPEEFSANHESTAAIMLEVAATALRDANLDPFAKPKNRTGVYIGHARGSSLAGELVFTTRIEEVLGHLERIEPFDAWTSDVKSAVVRQVIQDVRRTNPCRDLNGGPDITGNVVARIVSLALGLDGPYQAIDAACASSVYALSVAARALHAGEIQTALIGAASYSSWLSTILFSQAQALSANGSFPFDARADGFVSSDGYGALIVTTLDQALKDGDRIYSVISGVGVSSDGRGKSLWAPRLEGQVLAMQRAYRHVSESVVPQYIEAHGTSTQLGDATEIESISSVLRERGATQKVPVASVKANIGHTVEAAGLAGIIKTVLAMHHKVIPAATNFEHPNGNIDFENSPVFIPTESTDWPSLDSGERRAGVNSFAIGGLNGHVALSSVGDGDPKLYAVGLPALKPGNDEESVAIVGQGAVFAGARTAEGLGKLFDHSIRAIAPVPDNRWDSRRFYADAQAVPFRSSTRLGGFVTDFEYDWRRRGIPPKQLQTSDPLRFMIYDAVDQALCDAGLENREFDKKRTAVVVGTILTSDFFSELSLAVRAPEASAAIRTALGDHGISGADADEIVAEFASGFLTSNVALDDETGSFSASTLASGVARTFDFMGGAFVVDAGESSAFAALAAGRDLLLSGDFDVVVCAGAQRHLSLDGYEWYGMRGLLYQDCEPLAGGMIPGEGAGVVILKRLSDAQSAGDPVRAVLRSVSGSMAETAAQESSGSPPRFAGKGQSLVGHTMAASGMVTLLEGMASLERSKADGPLALECDSFGGLQFRAVLEPASNASGTDALRQDDWRTICLSAATLPELALRLGRASGEANSLFESARSYRDFASQSVRYDRHRLAIAFDSPESLAAKLTLAASLVGKPKSRPALEEQGAFLWDATQTPRIAMLFPGQGSQYEGMLRELLEASPAAAEKRRELDALLEADGRPGFAEIALGQGENLIDDVWGTQIAVYLGDLIFHAALLELGVRPEVLVGHSYGEYAALVAAKAWSSEQGLRVTNERCKAILSDERCRGVLIATNAPIDDVVRLQAGIAGIVEIANHNAPDQIVFGGEEPAAMELDRRLAAAGFSNRVLAVPRPFHTSLMASAMTPFRASLAFERIRLLSIPLLSSVTNRYVTDPLEIRENLVNQFVRPVLYADLVRRLVDDGANILIESGPRQILSRLNRRILGPDEQVAVLSADNPKRPGVESLARIAAALQSAGAISGASTTAPGRGRSTTSMQPNGGAWPCACRLSIHRRRSRSWQRAMSRQTNLRRFSSTSSATTPATRAIS
jgi:acyl transferase domain-containing protein